MLRSRLVKSAEKRNRDGKGNYLPPSREWGIHVVYGPPPQDVFGIAGRA